MVVGDLYLPKYLKFGLVSAVSFDVAEVDITNGSRRYAPEPASLFADDSAYRKLIYPWNVVLYCNVQRPRSNGSVKTRHGHVCS